MIKTSANDLLLYELCPRKWELFKTGHRDKKQTLAVYRFSSALHFAVKKHVVEMVSAHDTFDTYWGRYKENYPLIYRSGENWESLSSVGHSLIDKFVREFPAKNIQVILAENRLKLIAENWEYTSQPDMIGFRDNVDRYVVTDYKTTEEPVDEIWVRGSNQMTGAAMVVKNEFRIEQSADVDILICNFITKTRDIVWIWSKRTQADIEDYKKKIEHLTLQMQGAYHPKRELYAFNSPCKWCELTEICFPSGIVVNPKKQNGISLREFAFGARS